MRIVIIEDEERLLELLVDTLEVFDHEVSSFTEGKEGEAHIIANKENIDLVITDLSLADTNGEKIIEAIRSNNVTCPVIITTGSSIDIEEFNTRLGAPIHVLQKPFKRNVLFELIESL